EGIEIALVEGADELADGIGHAPSGAVTLLVLLAGATPAGVVAADFVVVVFDHRLDHVLAAAVRPDLPRGGQVDGAARGRGPGTGTGRHRDLFERRRLCLGGAARVIERLPV